MPADFKDPYDRDTARRWMRDPRRPTLDALVDYLENRLPHSDILLRPVRHPDFKAGTLKLAVTTLAGAELKAHILFEQDRPRLRIETLDTKAAGLQTGAGSACMLGIIDFAKHALLADTISLQAVSVGRNYWAANGFTMKECHFQSWREVTDFNFKKWRQEQPATSKRERQILQNAAEEIAAALPDRLDALANLQPGCKRYGSLGRRLFMTGLDYSARLAIDNPAQVAKVRKNLARRAGRLKDCQPA